MGPNGKDGLVASGAVAAGKEDALCVGAGNSDVVDGCIAVAVFAVVEVVDGLAKKLGIDPAGVSDAGFANSGGTAEGVVFPCLGVVAEAEVGADFLSSVGLFVVGANGVGAGAGGTHDFAFSASFSFSLSCSFSFSSLARIFFNEFASMSCFSHFENELEGRNFRPSPGLPMSGCAEETRRLVLLGARSNGF